MRIQVTDGCFSSPWFGSDIFTVKKTKEPQEKHSVYSYASKLTYSTVLYSIPRPKKNSIFVSI